MNPLVLFNTMVNGASFSSIDETGAPVGTGTEADTGAESTTSSFENKKKKIKIH
jgi:hypothetical protein